MSFPINVNIPNPPNDPADDCPLIKQNFANIDGYLKVDHVAAGAGGAGFHKQTTFNSLNPAGAQVDPVSVEYTNIGIADVTANRPQLYWRNSQVIIPLSAVRAFGSFVTTTFPAVPPFITQFNCNPVISRGIVPQYSISLLPNAIANDNVVVIVYASNGAAIGYTFTGGVLGLTSSSSSTFTINFLVLQI